MVSQFFYNSSPPFLSFSLNHLGIIARKQVESALPRNTEHHIDRFPKNKIPALSAFYLFDLSEPFFQFTPFTMQRPIT